MPAERSARYEYVIVGLLALFWGTVGLVVLTTAIILLSTNSSGSAGPPSTTLGNMNAF